MRKISTLKDDVVFTGSWVARINGKLKRQPHDIDIAVTSLDGLETLGEIICFKSNSLLSKDAIDRCVIDFEGTQIDIWVKDKLPEYEVKKGMKFQTLKSQVEYYNHLISINDNMFLTKILNRKLSILN